MPTRASIACTHFPFTPPPLCQSKSGKNTKGASAKTASKQGEFPHLPRLALPNDPLLCACPSPTTLTRSPYSRAGGSKPKKAAAKPRGGKAAAKALADVEAEAEAEDAASPAAEATV